MFDNNILSEMVFPKHLVAHPEAILTSQLASDGTNATVVPSLL